MSPVFLRFELCNSRNFVTCDNAFMPKLVIIFDFTVV